MLRVDNFRTDSYPVLQFDSYDLFALPYTPIFDRCLRSKDELRTIFQDSVGQGIEVLTELPECILLQCQLEQAA